MVRRVTEHTARNREGERLQVVTVYPVGVKKEQIKKENRYSKRHFVLSGNGKRFEFVK